MSDIATPLADNPSPDESMDQETSEVAQVDGEEIVTLEESEEVVILEESDASQVEETPSPTEISDEEAKEQLARELDELIERIKQVSPDYSPPPFSPQRMIALMAENLFMFIPKFALGIINQLRSGIAKDLMDLDTWRGIWYVVNYSIQSQKDLISRRVSGEYETDEWGYDPEVVAAVLPFFQFLYRTYWRVSVTGIENIPDQGRALLVSNHSGELPFDGSMVGLAVLNEHPEKRLVRTLYADWFPTLPVVSSLFVKMGQTFASEENGIRLLEQEELVAVYPEGYKGVGKLFKDRYHLARFGRGGFIRTALRAGAPVIPVSVVGAEETYITLGRSDALARLLGIPYFPVSPTFPWLGLLGLIPLPTKWFIDFGEPLPMNNYDSDAWENPLLISQLTDQIRNIIQNMVYARLAERKSVLFG